MSFGVRRVASGPFLRIVLLCIAGASWGGPLAAQGSIPQAPDEILVAFRPGTTEESRELALTEVGLGVIERFQHVDVWHVTVPRTIPVEVALRMIEASPAVLGASPNYLRSLSDHLVRPNDADFDLQWSLDNRGTNLVGAGGLTGPQLGIIDADIDAPQAWVHGTDCSGEVVAILDSGIDIAHPDFGGPFPAGNLWVNSLDPAGDADMNGNPDDDSNGIVDDIHGASFTGHEVHTDRAEVYVDANTNGSFTAGEAIYLDADHDLQVGALDVLLSGAAAAAGTALVSFGGNELHTDDLAADKLYGAGEAIYDDADGSLTVSAGDVHIQGAAQAVGTALIAFHAQGPLTGTQPYYSDGDSIYIDLDGNRKIGPGDALISGPALPTGAPLFDFFSLELHAENVNVGGTYDIGESIYRDLDASGMVSAGDAHQHGPVQAIGTALVGFGRKANGDLTDIDGHGTGVASLVGAVGNNGIDIAGICWRVQLLTVKVAKPGNPSPTTSIADEIAGINYVIGLKIRPADPVNVRIINFSAGGIGFSAPERNAIAAAGNNGILFVTAAGNDGRDNDGGVEVIYRDVDASALVSAGDVRLTGRRLSPTSFPAGSTVVAGDPDIGRGLVAFAGPEVHVDLDADAAYDQGEGIYADIDADGAVSAGDSRRSLVSAGALQFGPSTLVAAADGDIGIALVAFAANERHDEVNPADGALAPLQGNTPCAYDLANIICVAASESRDNLAGFSAWGMNSVDLAAPGLDIRMLRRGVDGGGAIFANGTSFSSPIVAGIAAHFWSRPEFSAHTIAELKERLLTGMGGPVFVPHPDGIDPCPGIRGFVASGGRTGRDGRARMVMGDDFGDAPPPYPTLLVAEGAGARHEDIGEEWLGRTMDIPPESVPPRPGGGGVAIISNVTPEFDAMDAVDWPADPDGFGNLVDLDNFDDGIGMPAQLTFGAPNTAIVHVFVTTENNGVQDAEGGRYGSGHAASDGSHDPADDKHIWVNGFFDWDGDGDWNDFAEHVFVLLVDPSAWGNAKGGYYEVEFDMPPQPAGVFFGYQWARFRLDYGENVGQGVALAMAPIPPVPSSPGGALRTWSDIGGLPFLPGAGAPQRYSSVDGGLAETLDLTYGVAQYGEVEDYWFEAVDALHREFIRGDCNSDSAVNIADSIFLLGALFPPLGSPPNLPGCRDACDTNDDGGINIADAIAVLASLFGSPTSPLPPPNVVSGCGLDPTDSDLLDCPTTACP